jgi:hypothetical protein
VTLPLTILVTLVLPILQQIISTVCGWVSSVLQIVKTVVDRVCRWLPWPLSTLCRLVSRVITIFQTVWNWVCRTVVNWITRLITYILTLITWVVRVICIIISIIIGLPGLLLCLLGVRPVRQVSVCIKVLTNAEGGSVVTEKGIQDSIALMQRVYRPCGLIVEIEGIERIVAPDLLTSTTDNAGDLFSFWHAWFSARACGCCNQLTVFFVDKIQGTADGYTYWGDNWCRVDGAANGDPTIMAHEIGHAMNLWHVGDNNNLMFANSGPPTNPRNKLEDWQCCWMRTSPFATAPQTGSLRANPRAAVG